METLYSQITEHLVTSGKRILERAGKIEDIGVAKADLTEEDLRIERELTNIIKDAYPEHYVYAEEENDVFEEHDDVWIIDPISGTDAFINGFPHFGLVAAHYHKGEGQFALVYDPSVNELFSAFKGEGAFLNGQKILVSKSSSRIVYNLAKPRIGSSESTELWSKLTKYDVHRNANSFAVNYCWVACGRYDGVVTLAKDSFTEYAGGFIISQAGGKFVNDENCEAFKNSDRLFVGANEGFMRTLYETISG